MTDTLGLLLVVAVRLFSLWVHRFRQISVRTHRCSVPVRLIGRTVRAVLHASELVVYDGRSEIARHERLIVKGKARLDLDHSLEALVREPGAFSWPPPSNRPVPQGGARSSMTPGGRRRRLLPMANGTAPGP
ncbi:Mu transposase domain-containing protein [Streptomyces phaeoluteigriseus]|uniref:Mu transposase domain-containing protein n=1 Tax=Streptomyces phaeoluteigriseus TaxID=114686 RepID=UPI0036AA09DD